MTSEGEPDKAITGSGKLGSPLLPGIDLKKKKVTESCAIGEEVKR